MFYGLTKAFTANQKDRYFKNQKPFNFVRITVPKVEMKL